MSANTQETKVTTKRVRKPKANKPDSPEAKIEKKVTQLIHTLQKTIEFEPLLQVFTRTVQIEIPFDGLQYTFEPKNIEINIGSVCQYTSTHQLAVKSQSLGQLILYRRKRFKELELRLLQPLVETLVYPIRNAIAYQEALQESLHDPLTNIGNRRNMQDSLHREIEAAKRYRSPMSLLMLDLDNFKAYNDVAGHRSGDTVLENLATVLKDCMRESDMVFRYGGDEFVVLLGKTNLVGAIQSAERLKDKITALLEPYNAMTTEEIDPLSVSMGVAPFLPNDNVVELFDRADRALYTAKNKGKNCLNCS